MSHHFKDDDDLTDDPLAFWRGAWNGFLIMCGACSVALFFAWLFGWLSIVR